VFALLAASEGRLRSAARLLGYAEMRYRTMSENAEPNEIAARDLASKRVAAGLAPEEARALMAQGERLSEDEVSALTLERALVHDPVG